MTCYVMLFVVVLSTTVILYHSDLIHDVSASSPSFPLQGIYNNHNSWFLEKQMQFEGARNITDCMTGPYKFPSPRIAALDYISDGKILNATLWLTAKVKDPSLFPPGFAEISKIYALLIHVDSSYDIGQTYQIIYLYSNISKTWSRIITESAPPGLQGEKILDQKHIPDSFVKGRNYADLSLNLSRIGSPSQYSIVSYTSDTYNVTKSSRICHLINVSDILHVPPPEFVISTLPNSLVLFAGDNKTIELQIKSNTILPSYISLNITDHSGNIKLKLIPNATSVLPSGLTTSLLQIKAMDNATSHPYTLPITAKISFPTTIANWLSGETHSNPQSAFINKESNFTITVIDKPPLLEQFKNMWESFGIPVSAIITLLATTGLSGIVGGWFLKKFNNKHSKKDKYRKMRDGWEC
jgi:hypothetical protein